MDIESLQKSDRRRGSCLDVFLVVSIISLFVSVAAVIAGGVMVVRDLQSKVDSSRKPLEFESSKSRGDTPSQEYKMQNFAYLDASSSTLRNSTMHWGSVDYGTGQSVGSNFVFDSEQQSLKLNRAGTYFMYIDLNLTCTYKCSAGLLTVRMGDKLTCHVDLPANSRPVSKRCWTVTSMVAETRLLGQMTAPNVEKDQNWKLELIGSGFGIFLVD